MDELVRDADGRGRNGRGAQDAEALALHGLHTYLQLTREEDIRMREKQLDEREHSLVAREAGSSNSKLAEAESTLQLLEDKYTCAL